MLFTARAGMCKCASTGDPDSTGREVVMVVVRVRSAVLIAAGFAAGVALLLLFWGWRADAAISGAESSFVPVAPQRVLDTRDPNNVGLDGPFVSQQSQLLHVTGAVPTANGTLTVVPDGATGVVLNVTAINSTTNAFVAIEPGTAIQAPTTSNLNFEVGDIIPNSATVSLPTSGDRAGDIRITFDAYAQPGQSDLLVDVVGYYTNAALQDLQAQIDALAAGGSTDLADRVAALEAANADQETRLVELETLLANVSLVQVDGEATLRISALNLQVVDGTGNTGGVTNGLGNVIVGYTQNVGDVRGGSHNLIVGDQHSYSGFGGFVAGFNNWIGGQSNTVAGGQGNEARILNFAAVLGGQSNDATGTASTISGGNLGLASGSWSSVSGGASNDATASYSSVSGGSNNLAAGSYSAVAGGASNEANGNWSSVAAGQFNQTNADYSAIAGGGGPVAGNGNETTATYNVVIGGDGVICNSASRVACGEVVVVVPD
jgi:hypothetical protein